MTEPERFERCLAEVLRHEGGFSNHPKDPGGATMRGVTQRVYDAYRAKQGKPLQSVRDIAPGELAHLYRVGYWQAASCDVLPAGVDLMVFDLAVNSGPDRAKKFLQAASGAEADGKIGPATLAAVRIVRPIILIQRIAQRRARFYRSLGTFPTFGKGWMRRLDAVTARAEEWAR